MFLYPESHARGAALYRATPGGENLRCKREGFKILVTHPWKLWNEAMGAAEEVQAQNDATKTSQCHFHHNVRRRRNHKVYGMYDKHSRVTNHPVYELPEWWDDQGPTTDENIGPIYQNIPSAYRPGGIYQELPAFQKVAELE
jgi:hypothetical protein